MNLFDIVGINRDDRGENMIVLTPSDHMLVPDFPACRKTAAPSPLSVMWRCPAKTHSSSPGAPAHPQWPDLILSGDTGSSTISLLKNKALPVGTLLVELIYVVEAQAPKQLQLNRFLPPTPVRLLLDKTVRTRPVRWSLKASTVS